MPCVAQHCLVRFNPRDVVVKAAIFQVENCFVIDTRTLIQNNQQSDGRPTHEVDIGPDCYGEFDKGLFVVPMFRLREITKNGELRRKGLGYELSVEEIYQGQMRYLFTLERQARELERQLMGLPGNRANVQEVLARAEQNSSFPKLETKALTHGCF